jgi:hypothetical protein
MLYAGWRGYVVAWFAVVWIANVYMSVFNLLRLDIKHENVAIAVEQAVMPVATNDGKSPSATPVSNKTGERKL